MIAELLASLSGLSGPQLHFVFLGLMASAGALIAGGTGALMVRRSHGGPVLRGVAIVAALLLTLAMLLARDVVGLDIFGEFAATLRRVMTLTVVVTGGASVLVAATAASARTGLIMGGVQGLGSLGLMVYVLLLASVPPGADPTWEIERFLEFSVMLNSGALLMLGVGYASARRQGPLGAALYALIAAAGVVGMLQGFAHHPGPRLSFTLPAWLPAGGVALWLLGLALRRADNDGPLAALGRATRRVDVRLLESRWALAAATIAPLLVGAAAVILAGSGSAREASRVSLGGLNITPGLAVPFFFAVGLGVVISRDQWRWRDWGGVALTVALAGLLLAQKEVGNTAVVLMVAAVVFLVARGTLPHLLMGGALGTAALAIAYQLAPIISAIPFTVRERVHLWLGGAELLQRGGHLITASYVGFRVGGFWGLGVHASPDLNLPRLVVALHTDFPLVVLGLFGGALLLGLYVLFFVCLAVLLMHTLRTMNFQGDTRRARLQAPLLVGLWAVPVISTTLNLAGAISQVTPFTGVPVLLVSTSAIFVVGNFFIIAAFVLTGNRDALRRQLKHRADAELSAQAIEGGNPVGDDLATTTHAEDLTSDGEPTTPAVASSRGGWRHALWRRWRRWTTLASWRMRLLSARRHLRLRRLDQGALIVMLALPLLGAVFTARIAERYLDDTRYYGHPRLQSSIRVEPTQDAEVLNTRTTQAPLRPSAANDGTAQAPPQAPSAPPAASDAATMASPSPSDAQAPSARWRVTEAQRAQLVGPLTSQKTLLVDSVLMGFKQGRLQVRGGCYDPEKIDGEGVWLGFLGLLDAPELAVVQDLTRPAIDKLDDSDRPDRANDIVLPFGDIASHHLQVRRLPSGRYHLKPLSTHAVWHAIDAEGRRIPGKVTVIDEGQGFAIGARRPRRFFITPSQEGGRVCVAMRRGAIFEYPLSARGPTVIGGMTLLRRQLATRTTDLTFAEDVKLAAEAGLISAPERGGPLVVAPHDPETRQGWDNDTRRRFFRVFRPLRVKQDDGGVKEVLAWSRPFYTDGGRRFDGARELGAFVLHEGMVLGLADTWRFSRTLPTRYNPHDPRRNGLLRDRHGEPVVELLPASGKVVSRLPGAGALIGVDLRRAGIRDGLLRVFHRMLQGVEPLPDVHRELEDRLAEREPGSWGWDVTLTLDKRIQEATFEALRDEVEVLDAKEPGEVHHASVIVLGPRNEILALAQMPDTGPLETVEQVKALKTLQRDTPLDAPALDVFHRRTTQGSTIKLITLVMGFRHKDEALRQWRDGEWYVNAEGDDRNARDGRFMERGGALTSWRGESIAPIRNYGGSRFSDVVPLRTLLVKSLNTASAYLGLNIGRDRFEGYFEDLGLASRVDLLPAPLGPEGPWAHLMDRSSRDAASALSVSLGAIPKDEPWTPSLTARLPLSGLSDYSVFSLAAGSSVIARGGRYHAPRLVRAIRSRRTGQEIRFAPDEPQDIIDAEDAEVIKSYMRDVIAYGTAGSYRRGVPKEVWSVTGGKTGTGETTRPVDPNARYDRKNKPKTRDHKAFVGVWPTDSPEPYVVAVNFEYVSHLDTRVAIRTTQRVMEAIRALHLADHADPADPSKIKK